jgi:hypothetical protein
VNERELRRLFRRILVSTVPLQAALAAEACGGVTTTSTVGQSDPNGNGTGGQSLSSDAGQCMTGACGPGGTGGSGGVRVGSCAVEECVGGAAGRGGGFGAGGFIGRPAPGLGGVTNRTGGGVTGAGGAVTPEDPCAPAPPNPFCSGPAVCVALPEVLKNQQPDAAPLSQAFCQTSCPDTFYWSCAVVVSQGEQKLQCYQLCEGRRPEGLDGEVFGGTDLGAFFAQMAHLEAASVAAFRILHRELAKHGAPRSFRRAARQAARDEIRHTRIARALARRHGGTYVPPRIARPAERSLEAVAIENAVEGCVRETYGALAAAFHAHNAVDPTIRRAMRSIARDEARHAALSWRIFRWANRRLSPESQRRVLSERDQAAAALINELGHNPPPSVVTTAGAPRPTVARELARALSRALAAR